MNPNKKAIIENIVTGKGKPFDLGQALLLQTEQLNRWKPLLKDDKFNELCAYVHGKNVELMMCDNPSPYDVFRGQDIDSAVRCKI